jgi:hypothetical protein
LLSQEGQKWTTFTPPAPPTWRRYRGLILHRRSHHWSQWPEAGIGVACGAVVGIDIDFLDAEKAHETDLLARRNLGDTPALRIGQAPKRLLVYRADEPVVSRSFGPLEILGSGRQFVAYGIHPRSGMPYHWPDEGLADLRLTDLPLVSEVRLGEFIYLAHQRFSDDLAPLKDLKTAGAQRMKNVSERVPNPELRGNPPAIRDAMAYLSNKDLPYNDWIMLGLAIKGALGEEGWPLFAEWSGQSTKDIPSATAKAWQSFRPNRIGAGTIFYLARKAGWSPPAALRFDRNPEIPHPARKFFKEY